MKAIQFSNRDNVVDVDSLSDGHLVQFKVFAPYDGCFWMYDYAYLYAEEDGSLNWTNPILLGSKFVHCLNDVLQGEDPHSIYLYNLKDAEGLKEFVTECNEQNVNHVSTFLDSKSYITLEMPCPKCNCKTTVHEMVSTSYHGDGGIGIVNCNYVCQECYSNGSCNECGEYFGNDLTFVEAEGCDLCEYCLESRHGKVLS